MFQFAKLFAAVWSIWSDQQFRLMIVDFLDLTSYINKNLLIFSFKAYLPPSCVKSMVTFVVTVCTFEHVGRYFMFMHLLITQYNYM